MNRIVLAMVVVVLGSLCSCSRSLAGDSAVVELPNPECQNASLIEVGSDSYEPVGNLPAGWQGMRQVEVEITDHRGDRISVEDERGRVAEFKRLGEVQTTECVNW